MFFFRIDVALQQNLYQNTINNKEYIIFAEYYNKQYSQDYRQIMWLSR